MLKAAFCQHVAIQVTSLPAILFNDEGLGQTAASVAEVLSRLHIKDSESRDNPFGTQYTGTIDGLGLTKKCVINDDSAN